MQKQFDLKREIHYLEFYNRENDFLRRTYLKDMEQYDLLREGDSKALEAGKISFDPSIQGHLSDDPVKNAKYLFVASIALTCRYAIMGGMNQQASYDTSDVYIKQMDKLDNVADIISLQNEMFKFYLDEVIKARKDSAKVLPIRRCLDHIYNHLNEHITVEDLADTVSLNPNYLSTLFKTEMGVSISQYIRNQRIEVACNMLRHSDYTYSEIAATLAFSSQSHFIKVFKEETGMTPKEYRNKA